MKRILLLTISLITYFFSTAQNLSFTCPRDTVLGCNSACFTLKAKFPDIRDVGNDYTLENATPVSVCRPYDPPAVVGPSTNLSIDDRYSAVIPIGFNFPFYGTVYSSLVVSTNGYISFNVALTGAFSAWVLAGNVPSATYDGALVMCPWHDLQPDQSAAPTSPTQQIKFNMVGTAPNRKWVLTFYKVPQFSCTTLIENTQQLVLHESTGVIEVFIFDKQICATWNSGKAMVGLQDMTKTKGIVPPGRGAADPPWGAIGMNEVWRFIPTGGAPLYRSVQLLDAAGTVVATGDTTRINSNTFEASFPNVCPPAGASFYVVKTTYQKLNDPTGTVFSLDTVNVIRQAALPLTATMTPTTCGAFTGTVTATAAGTAPYQYSIDGGTLQGSNVFTNVGVGTHVIYAIDNTGCNNTINIDVTSTSSLPSTLTFTNPTCAGVNNGTITVTPTAGAAPYSYSINGGATTQPTGVFTNLGPGTYTVQFTDANLCTGSSAAQVLSAGASLSASQTKTNTTCNGATDGTITITPAVPGAYTYTLNPGSISNNTGVFIGLAAATYSVAITSAIGCTGLVSNIVIAVGGSISGTWTKVNESCPGANDGVITVTPVVAGAYTFTLTPGPVSNNTGVFTGMVPGTFYSVQFTNSTGCSGNMTNLFVLPGATVSATEVHANPSCAGVNDGTITVTPVPAGAYTYTLNPGGIVNNTGVFTALLANTYSVTLTNAGGCGTTISNIVLSTAAGVSATAVATNATCTGVNDGVITVTPPPNGGPFIYTLNPGNIVQNNNPVFTGLATGTYFISFTIAAGCGGTVSPDPVVAAGNNPVGTAVTANTSCPAVSNGTLTVTPPATGGPFIYTLNPGNIIQNNNPVFTGLAAGTYTVSFTTAAGCIGTISPNPVVAASSTASTTAAAVNTSCPGVNNGTITVTPPATGGPFSYTLNPGNIVQNNNPVFTGLATGTYTITYLNAVGCSGNISPDPVIVNGAAPSATAVTASTTCPGVNNGTITVTPPATGGPFIYTLNPGNIVQNNNPVFIGLAPNTYTISFTTAIGCSGTVNPNPVVSSGTAPVATASAANTTCPGVNDGTITVTPPATGGPFIYTLNPGNIIQNNNPVFTGLASNTYTISFTTVIGCIGTVSPNPVVATGAAPVATASTANTTCPGVNDGIITVTPPTTGGPFIYTLNPGNIIQNNNPVFIGLAPNTYTISFTTAIGCNGVVAANQVVLAGPPLAANTPGIGNPPCAFINDGTLTINPSLAGIYTYVLNPGLPGQVTQANNPTFTGLAPATYTYSFTNSSGCIGIGTATLTTHAPLATTVAFTMPLCNGNSNGIISLNASGGLAPYQYAISPFTTFQVGTFNGLATGTYTFRIKDNAGCIKDTTVTLLEPTLLTATASSTAGTCNGNDGNIIVSGFGGTPAYTYSIDNGATYQTPDAFIVSGGNYPNIRVKDSKGCIANTNVNVTLVDNMFLIPANDTTICAEQTVTFQPNVSAQASIFQWSTIPDSTLISTLNFDTIKNPIASPLDTTTYVLHTEWGVCSRNDTITIYLLHKPIPNAGRDTAVCYDNTVAFLNGTATNLSGTVNFEWSDTTNLQTPHNASTIATPTATETFTLTVTDNYGCNFSVTDMMVVTVQPPVPAFAGNDTIGITGQPHELMGSGGVNYLWSPAAPLNFSTVPHPLATLTHDQQFTVIVTDVAGCIGYDTVFVRVYPGPAYHVPNAFSPNGDGLNDVFRVVPAGISYTEWFRVFNRYGEMVFETNKWLKGWDGTYRGKKQPVGNYVWVLKGVDRNGKVIEMKGTVLLVQ